MSDKTTRVLHFIIHRHSNLRCEQCGKESAMAVSIITLLREFRVHLCRECWEEIREPSEPTVEQILDQAADRN